MLKSARLRERRHRALTQDLRVPLDPIEEHPLELLERACQTPQRARRVHPHERLGMKEQRLDHLQRAIDERLIAPAAIARPAALAIKLPETSIVR